MTVRLGRPMICAGLPHDRLRFANDPHDFCHPEWVDESRLLAYTKANIAEAARLKKLDQQEPAARPKEAAAKKTEEPASTGGGSIAGKKRRRAAESAPPPPLGSGAGGGSGSAHERCALLPRPSATVRTPTLSDAALQSCSSAPEAQQQRPSPAACQHGRRRGRPPRAGKGPCALAAAGLPASGDPHCGASGPAAGVQAGVGVSREQPCCEKWRKQLLRFNGSPLDQFS